jgi:hypothetical protein
MGGGFLHDSGSKSADQLPLGTDGQYAQIEIGNMVDGFPEDEVIHAYIHSNLDVQASPTTQYTLGNNLNNGRTALTPWADLWYAEKVLGSRMRHGKQVEFHLGGGMTEGSGTDPFVNPTGVRYYPMMDVSVGGGEAFRPNVRWYGPRKMYRVLSGLETLTAASLTNVGLSTRVTFNENIGAAGTFSYGRFLRVVDNATGYQVTNPIQIAVHEGTSSVLLDCGPIAAGGILLADGSQTYSIVQPAVQIMNRGTNRLGGSGASPDGTWINGRGAFETGGYEAENNFLYNFNWMSIERAYVSGDGLSFNGVYFYTGDGQDACVFRGGWSKLMGCSTYGNMRWLCSSHAVPFGTSSATDALRGFAYDYDGPPYPSGDPRYPHRGPISLQVSNGSMYVGSNECDGNFSVPVGALSVRCDTGSVGITVNGQGSRFTQYANGTGLVTIGGHDGTNHPAIGMRVMGGGRARIDDLNGLFVVSSTTSALQLGVGGANVSLGTGAGGLRQGAGYNGYAYVNGNTILDCGNAAG